MLLKKLIKTSSNNIKNIKVSGISLDSRKVKKNHLFFALKGTSTHGEKFVNHAIKNGACAIISSKKLNLKNNKIPLIIVRDPKKTLERVCVNFFSKKPKNIIAVTGTNGKSSVADFFHQILSYNKIPVASIGTLGVKANNKIFKSDLTSPDIISLHQKLEKLKKLNIENVIIEASSHGLHQGRLNGLNFKAGIFTNFSQDHLDYHSSMKSYFDSKMILFSKLLKKNMHIISDSEIYEFSKLKKVAFKNHFKILDINQKTTPLLDANKINLIGNFQIKNLSMSILAARLCGIRNKDIKLSLKKIKNVNGRMELVRKLENKAKVFIDYAHTPEALNTALQSLNDKFNCKINLVFGCGGERDVQKRSLMAKIAKKYCKKIYVTDDNPRRENAKKIRKSIIRHLNKGTYFDIANREKAIKKAILESEAYNIILIAGKGHESHQDYGNKLIKISDKYIVKKIKIKRKKLFQKKYNYLFNSKILNKIVNKKKIYKFKGVSISSKEIKKDNLFIAIKGKNNDGHKYVKEAIKNGASYCVVEKKIKNINTNKLIKCINTKTFLNKIAVNKRKELRAKIIAVTGSSGKTTLKTLLGKLLNNYGKTYFSPRSFNNHYGVPVSLSNTECYHDFGVFEIGMSKPGEINKLSNMIKPQIAIITNIAEAHIENFKSLKGIAKEKAEIIKNINSNGTLILNRDDKFYNYTNRLAKLKKIKTISFGFSKKSDVHPIFSKRKKNAKVFKVKVIDETISIEAFDINIYNILSSLAALKILNLNLKKILKIFSSFRSLDGRGRTYLVNRFKTTFRLIDESYNANPLSVKNAIVNFGKIKKNKFKKYLLLGDMLELGKKSDYYHKNLSKFINNTDIDKVFVYGDKILNTYKHTYKKKRGNILNHKKDFEVNFSKIIKKNDYLMIKGSNATGLNNISKRIIKGHKNVI